MIREERTDEDDETADWLKAQNEFIGSDSLRGSSVKIGTIQRRLAWPLRKDDTHKSRSVNKTSSLDHVDFSCADSPVVRDPLSDAGGPRFKSQTGWVTGKPTSKPLEG